jgi:hypothetical protein
MSLTIAGSDEIKTFIITDQELQEMVASCDEGDYYCIEQKIKERIEKQRPNEKVNVHIYNLSPFQVGILFGDSPLDGWWEL